MALKTIETKAVISAQDQTGTTFAQVAQKLRQMEDRAASAGKKLASTTKAVETARAASGKAAGASQIVGGAAGVVTAIIASESIRALAEAIGARIHEAVRMETAGFKPEEIEEGKRLAARLSTKYPSVSQTALMHMFRTAVATTGDVEEAKKAMEPLAPLRVVAQAAHPGADVTEDMDKLIKGLEIKGVTQHPEEFKEYMQGIAKGLNAFGDTLKPYQYYEMFKYGRQATPGLSSDFILKVAPTVAQEMGGSSFGKAVSSFNAAIVGGVMKHSAIKDFLNLGLVRPEDVIYTTTGSIKGLKPGKHVEGWRTAQADPYAWVQQYLLPALNKAGVTSREDILGRIPQLFQNQITGQLIGLLLTQQPRIEKDIRMLSGAKGLEAADIYGAKDLGVQVQGFKNAVSNSTATLGERLIVNTGALNSVTDSLNRMNEKMVNAKPGSGQEKFDRVMNSIFAPEPAEPAGYAAAKRQTANLGNAAIRLDTAGAEAREARRRYDDVSYFHQIDKTRAMAPLLDATNGRTFRPPGLHRCTPIGRRQPGPFAARGTLSAQRAPAWHLVASAFREGSGRKDRRLGESRCGFADRSCRWVCPARDPEGEQRRRRCRRQHAALRPP
jgi:hypothetical protein